MNIDQFFDKYFDGDKQKVEVIEIDDDLVIVGKEQYKRIEPIIGLISFINPSHKLILKKVNLIGVEIINPTINLEFNQYYAINQLDISKIKVRCVYFVNCRLIPPNFTITFDNIIVDNSELMGPMNIKSKSITFLKNVGIFGTVNISGDFRAFYPIKISNIDTDTNFLKGCLNIVS